MRRLFRSGLLAWIGSLAACGATRESTPEGDAPVAGGTANQGRGGGTLMAEGGVARGGANQGGMDSLNVAGGNGSGTGGATCASDLRTIVDEKGAFIRQCPSDEGCADGACVPVCDAVARSNGSIGCDFWALKPTCSYSASNPEHQLDRLCYAVILTNAWSRPAKISVSRMGKTLDLNTFARLLKGTAPAVTYEPLPDTGVPPNEVAVLFLSGKPQSTGHPLECPSTAVAIEADPSIQGAGRGSAFHVVSDTPLSAYDLLPYRSTQTGGMGPSASLLLPTPTWGTNFLALAPRAFGPLERLDPGMIVGQPWLAVVAREDATTVRVAAKESLPGGNGVAPAPKGQVIEYTLNAGEAVQWIDEIKDTNITDRADFVQPRDPSGTVLASDKPIGLWAGHTFMPVVSTTSGTRAYFQSVHQQMAPIRALGHEYVGAGIVTRRVSGQPESVPYRLLGVAKGTELTWDPLPSAAAPLTLDQGQVAEFETTSSFSVRSQDADHPFVFTEYMPTVPVADGPQPLSCSSRLGEEDWVNQVPTQQFLSHYVFFSEPTYASTNLVVVRQKGPSGFQDVELDCLGTVDGWQPVGSLGRFEVAQVDLVRFGVPVKDCATARHVARSEGAFGVTLWGTDCSASYGYAAGGDFGPVNEVVVAPVVR